MKTKRPSPDQANSSSKFLDPQLINAATDALVEKLPTMSLLCLYSTSSELYPTALYSRMALTVIWNNFWNIFPSIAYIRRLGDEAFQTLLTKPIVIPVRAPSGQLFRNLTVFQIALYAQNFELCEMFKKYFIELPHGLKIMQQQIHAVYPKGGVECIAVQKRDAKIFATQYIQPLLNYMTDKKTPSTDITSVLEHNPCNPTLESLIADFRKAVDTIHAPNVAFNPFYLLEACNLLCEYLKRFKNNGWADLFLIQVVGLLESYAPAHYLQAFAQGLEKLVNRGGFFGYSFRLNYPTNRLIKINRTEQSGLGYHYFIEFNRGHQSEWQSIEPIIHMRRGLMMPATPDLFWHRTYQKFVDQQHAHMTNFISNNTSASTPGVI